MLEICDTVAVVDEVPTDPGYSNTLVCVEFADNTGAVTRLLGHLRKDEEDGVVAGPNAELLLLRCVLNKPVPKLSG